MNVCINREAGYISRWMGIWDKCFLRDFISALFIKKTTIMSKLWLNPHKKPEKNAERNRHFLEKESFSDFPSRIEKRCFHLVWEVEDTDFICMDEVDIAKPCAEKMEWLSLVRDGSTWEIVNGYLFHGVSIHGVPVILERENLEKETKGMIFKRIVNRIISHTKGCWIFLLDAYYDIASYFDCLVQRKCKFIVRAKRNRILFDPSSQTYKKMKDFPVGIHTIRLPKKEYNLFLHVVKSEKYPEPMRVITNTDNPQACRTYFKRWEIEQVFKTMKQEFGMEEIRTQSLAMLDNVIATIQLVVGISNACFNSQSTQNTFRWTKLFRVGKEFQKKFDTFTRRNGLTMNRNSIVTFISFTLERLYKWPPRNPNRRINRNPLDSAQQRLFTAHWTSFVYNL